MATKTFSVSLPRFRVTAKTAATLNQHLQWLNFLAGDQFYQDFKIRFESEEIKSQIQSNARELIRALIYAVHPDPGTRTDSLFNSILTISDTGAIANLALFSDPGIATSKGNPQVSYLEYFEPLSPIHTRTFIKPSGTPSRPFFITLENFMFQITERHAASSYERSILSRLPAQ